MDLKKNLLMLQNKYYWNLEIFMIYTSKVSQIHRVLKIMLKKI